MYTVSLANNSDTPYQKNKMASALRELTDEEVEKVGGGLLPLAVIGVSFALGGAAAVLSIGIAFHSGATPSQAFRIGIVTGTATVVGTLSTLFLAPVAIGAFQTFVSGLVGVSLGSVAGLVADRFAGAYLGQESNIFNNSNSFGSELGGGATQGVIDIGASSFFGGFGTSLGGSVAPSSDGGYGGGGSYSGGGSYGGGGGGGGSFNPQGGDC